jgi:acyl-CoA thioester hydrolase
MTAFKFPLTLELRIDWSEMDIYGHVNNVMFMKYVQAARVNYWEQIGLTNYMQSDKIGPMLASTNCQFKKPLQYPGKVIIHTRMDFIKNSSFGLFHHLFNEAGDLCAEATDVMVLYDFSKNEKVNFLQDLRDKVKLLEGKDF